MDFGSRFSQLIPEVRRARLENAEVIDDWWEPSHTIILQEKTT